MLWESNKIQGKVQSLTFSEEDKKKIIGASLGFNVTQRWYHSWH